MFSVALRARHRDFLIVSDPTGNCFSQRILGFSESLGFIFTGRAAFR